MGIVRTVVKTINKIIKPGSTPAQTTTYTGPGVYSGADLPKIIEAIKSGVPNIYTPPKGTPYSTYTGGGGGGGGSAPVVSSPAFVNQVLQSSGLNRNESKATSNAIQLKLLLQRRDAASQNKARQLANYFQRGGIVQLKKAAAKVSGDLYQKALGGYTSARNFGTKTLKKYATLDNKGIKIIDTLSGGKLTNKVLDKVQVGLNQQYDSFDKKYGGKELPPEEYDRATQIINQLDKIQQNIDTKRANAGQTLRSLTSSTSSKSGGKLTFGKFLKNYGVGQLSIGPTSKRNQAQALGVGVALANALISAGETPTMINAIRKNPGLFVKSLKDIPKSLKDVAVNRAKLFVINPDMAIAQVSTELGVQYVALKGTSKGFKVAGQLTRKGVTRLSPYFSKLETTPLGIRTITNVRKVGKIELIEQRGTRIRNVNPIKAVNEANLIKQLKPKPTLPKVNLIQKKILAIVKRRGDVISGSYAQNVFLKGKFSRAFKDLDILTTNRAALMRALKNKFGRAVTFKKKLRSIELKYRGKVIADMVEFAQGEKLKGVSYLQKYGFAKVNGLNVVRPQVRLASKVAQLGIGKGGKVLKDIELLYGKKGTPFKRPSFTGPYSGRQAKVGTRSTLTSSQSDLFKMNALQKIRDIILRKKPSLKLKKWFYATPEIDGIVQARVTRLGLPGKQEASLIDLFSGKATLSKGKPTIFVLPKEKIFSAPKGITKGKFLKTRGFVVPNFTRELEVTLGKGYLIKQGKRLGTTLIDGNRVSIIQLEKIKIPKNIKAAVKAIEKLGKKLERKGISLKSKNKILRKLSSKQTKLSKNIKRVTKVDYASRRPGRRVYPLGRKLGSSAFQVVRKFGRSSSSIRRSTSRSISRAPSTPYRRIGGSSSGGVLRRGGSSTISPRYSRPIIRRGGSSITRPRYSRGGGRGGGRVRVLFRGSKKRITKLSKAIPTFNVYGKVGRKFVKLNKGFLTKQDALNKGAFAVDNYTAKTFKIIRAGKRKQISSIPNIEKGYFRKAGFKLREYRIKRGRKFAILPKYIEKRRYGIDTRGEKRGLKISDYLKSRGFSKEARAEVERQNIVGRSRVSAPRHFKRRFTPTQRRVMIKNLAKARRVWARKRR